MTINNHYAQQYKKENQYWYETEIISEALVGTGAQKWLKKTHKIKKYPPENMW